MPAFHLITNIDLGSKKTEVMKACAIALAKVTGKPEKVFLITFDDKADLIFGGTEAPAVLGNMYSLGTSNQETNGKVTAAVTDLLQEFGLDETRIYINFHFMEMANMGWSRKTFAG